MIDIHFNVLDHKDYVWRMWMCDNCRVLVSGSVVKDSREARITAALSKAKDVGMKIAEDSLQKK